MQESELPRILGSRGNRGLLREEKEKGESEDITTGWANSLGRSENAD